MNKKLWQRQMSLGEILSEGFRLIQINFVPMLLLVLCSQVPFNLLRTLLSDFITVDRFGQPYTALISTGISFINFLLSLFVSIGIAYIVELSLQGKLVPLKEIFKFNLSRLDDVFGTSLLQSIVILGLTLLFIVPGIIWANYYSFAITATSLRNMRARAALKYSKKLIQGQWWRVFRIHIAIIIPTFIFGLISLFLSRMVSDIKFLYIFVPMTIANFVGVIASVMTVVLFLNTEYVRELQRQNRSKTKRT
jgi:hypothetical protein